MSATLDRLPVCYLANQQSVFFLREDEMTAVARATVQLEELELAFREAGSGPPVVLLHGWPTSSVLWQAVMPHIARHNRVIAPDLPGFGDSDKPVGVRYDFELFERALDGLLAALDVDEVAVGGHDLGGPVALHWALGHPGRVTKLALLNTLVYPEFSQEVIEFVRALRTPDARDRMTSPEGLEAILRRGFADESNLSDELLSAVRGPFQDEDSRAALAAAAIQLSPEGFAEIAQALPRLDIPVRILYGARDRLLPDIAETVARLERDLPHAIITPFPDSGHFVQQESPEEVGELLAEFFTS